MGHSHGASVAASRGCALARSHHASAGLLVPVCPHVLERAPRRSVRRKLASSRPLGSGAGPCQWRLPGETPTRTRGPGPSLSESAHSGTATRRKFKLPALSARPKCQRSRAPAADAASTARAHLGGHSRARRRGSTGGISGPPSPGLVHLVAKILPSLRFRIVVPRTRRSRLRQLP